MSNKLVEHQESKEILTGNQKKILFWICFIILSIAFITVWINILLTSKAFNTQMEEMVLGEDYYMEDIVITGKRAEDASADMISQNYFFYYNNGKVNDYHKRMQVPGFVYSEYNVGDSIAAYTTDHVSYSYYKYGILSDTEYTNNELMKVAGVLLGIGIFLLALFGGLSKSPTGAFIVLLRSTNANLYIKENIDETVFMFALFKCRKSDKGRN